MRPLRGRTFLPETLRISDHTYADFRSRYQTSGRLHLEGVHLLVEYVTFYQTVSFKTTSTPLDFIAWSNEVANVV